MADENEEGRKICWLKVMFPDKVNHIPVIFKIWWNEEERLTAVVDNFQRHFNQFGEGMKYELLDEDDGRREAGRMVFDSYWPWEEMVQKNMLVPTVMQFGTEN